MSGEKLDLHEAERASLFERGTLITDFAGNELLRGLSVDEARWFVGLHRANVAWLEGKRANPPGEEERARWLRMHRRVDLARVQGTTSPYLTHTAKPKGLVPARRSNPRGLGDVIPEDAEPPQQEVRPSSLTDG